jgi:hypothetical protein
MAEVEVATQPVNGEAAVEMPPLADGPVPRLTPFLKPAPRAKEPSQQSPEPAQPIASVDKTSYQDFKAGDTDPLVGVIIKEVLIKADTFIVYIDQDHVLRWHWNAVVDSSRAAPIFNRAGELQAKSEFLRQTPRKRDLISARRLIGEGLVVMFCTQNQAYANAALDAAEKFITQIGRETSRGWYFVPFFLFFGVSVLTGLILYRHGQMRITTLPLVCSLGGGIGAFISTAIGNERIPCAPTAGRSLHLLEALLRYTIGFAAGLLVWLAISGNIAIGFLNLANSSVSPPANPWPGNPLPPSVYALVAMALLAGASERLLPSLIAKFDDSTKTTETPQTANTETTQPNSTGAATDGYSAAS